MSMKENSTDGYCAIINIFKRANLFSHLKRQDEKEEKKHGSSKLIHNG